MRLAPNQINSCPTRVSGAPLVDIAEEGSMPYRFQSSPDPRIGRSVGFQENTWPPDLFQSSPDPRVGRSSGHA